MKPKVVLLHAWGTNRDLDLAEAFELAGAEPRILLAREAASIRSALEDCQVLALPGGFSYGDALGAGRLWALDLKLYLEEAVRQFAERGKPILGICNGFQTLVRCGLLPGPSGPPSTLTHNAQGRFECRWVTLQPCSRRCLWTAGLDELIDCPVAHGEGNFQTLELSGVEVALRYVHRNGSPALGYPDNPNGSVDDVAGICNPAGNILGLMPHPENHLWPWQHPLYPRGFRGRSGLALLKAGLLQA